MHKKSSSEHRFLAISYIKIVLKMRWQIERCKAVVGAKILLQANGKHSHRQWVCHVPHLCHCDSQMAGVLLTNNPSTLLR